MTNPTDFQALAAAIGAEISLPGSERLLAYLDAMLDENTRINLTAVRDRESAVLFHALDSVAMGICALDGSPTRALDIGTGNGFPGVAVACQFPDAQVVLMDRTAKKLNAINRALRTAGFDPSQFETVQMNAVEAPARGYSNSFDLVVTRAVGPPQPMGALARPLLQKTGSLLTWLSDNTEAPESLKRGLRLVGVHSYSLPDPVDRVRRLAHYRF